MASRLLVALVLALWAGCGSSEPAARPLPEKRPAPAVPPAEMRMILEGLKSDDAHTQYAALATLGRFPAVLQTHRGHVERLQTEGKTPEVRQKAAELLGWLEKTLQNSTKR